MITNTTEIDIKEQAIEKLRESFFENNPELYDWIVQTFINEPKGYLNEADDAMLASMSENEKMHFAYIIQITTFNEPNHNDLFAITEVRDVLLEFTKSGDEDMQEAALKAIVCITYCESGMRLFTTIEAKEALLTLTQSKNTDIREYASVAIAFIFESELGRELFSPEQTRTSLLSLTQSENVARKKIASGIMQNITTSEDGKNIFATKETRDILLELIQTESGDYKECVTAIIADITECDAGKNIFATEETRDILLELIQATSRDYKEYATGIIGNITECDAGKNIFATEETRAILLKLIQTESGDYKEYVTAIITDITKCDAGKNIFATKEVRDALLMLTRSENSEDYKKYFTAVIGNITRCEAGKNIFATKETRDVLLELIQVENVNFKKIAMSVIEDIAECDAGKNMFATEETRDILLELIQAENEKIKILSLEIIIKIIECDIGKSIFTTAETRDALLKPGNEAMLFHTLTIMAGISDKNREGQILFSTQSTAAFLSKLIESDDEDHQKFASGVIGNIAFNNSIGQNIFGTNAIKNSLLTLTKSENKDVKKYAVWAIANIICNDPNSQEILTNTPQISEILLKYFAASQDKEFKSALIPLLDKLNIEYPQKGGLVTNLNNEETNNKSSELETTKPNSVDLNITSSEIAQLREKVSALNTKIDETQLSRTEDINLIEKKFSEAEENLAKTRSELEHKYASKIKELEASKNTKQEQELANLKLESETKIKNLELSYAENIAKLRSEFKEAQIKSENISYLPSLSEYERNIFNKLSQRTSLSEEEISLIQEAADLHVKTQLSVMSDMFESCLPGEVGSQVQKERELIKSNKKWEQHYKDAKYIGNGILSVAVFSDFTGLGKSLSSSDNATSALEGTARAVSSAMEEVPFGALFVNIMGSAVSSKLNKKHDKYQSKIIDLLEDSASENERLIEAFARKLTLALRDDLLTEIEDKKSSRIDKFKSLYQGLKHDLIGKNVNHSSKRELDIEAAGNMHGMFKQILSYKGNLKNLSALEKIDIMLKSAFQSRSERKTSMTLNESSVSPLASQPPTQRKQTKAWTPKLSTTNNDDFTKKAQDIQSKKNIIITLTKQIDEDLEDQYRKRNDVSEKGKTVYFKNILKLELMSLFCKSKIITEKLDIDNISSTKIYNKDMNHIFNPNEIKEITNYFNKSFIQPNGGFDPNYINAQLSLITKSILSLYKAQIKQLDILHIEALSKVMVSNISDGIIKHNHKAYNLIEILELGEARLLNNFLDQESKSAVIIEAKNLIEETGIELENGSIYLREGITDIGKYGVRKVSSAEWDDTKLKNLHYHCIRYGSRMKLVDSDSNSDSESDKDVMNNDKIAREVQIQLQRERLKWQAENKTIIDQMQSMLTSAPLSHVEKVNNNCAAEDFSNSDQSNTL